MFLKKAKEMVYVYEHLGFCHQMIFMISFTGQNSETE